MKRPADAGLFIRMQWASTHDPSLLGEALEGLLASGEHLPLPLGAGLLIVLALLEFAQDSGLLAFALETTQCIFEGLVFLDLHQWHVWTPPLAVESLMSVVGIRAEGQNTPGTGVLRAFFAEAAEESGGIACCDYGSKVRIFRFQ
jgi:hypothetical protein